MQVPGPFEYERATSVDHAVGLLDRLGEGAFIVAGGHSLLPMMKLRIANPEYLIDINDLAGELGYITVGAAGPATSGGAPTLVRLGAMTRHREVLEDAALATVCPIFADAERVIADPVVRNRGTVGGSLCQADPAEDLSTVCEVLGAVVVARGPSGQREIGIDDFMLGPYETALAHNEMLIEVRIPLRHNTSSAYAKVERRVGDWAVAAAGAAVTLDGDQIVAGRVGLTAVNADSEALAVVTEALVGSPPTEETFAEAGRLAAQACEPATDQRGTADYKRHLASELTIRTLRTAVQRVRDIPDPKGT
jgi:carbon-monoxide dehydrogenase medium subunit